MFKNTASQKLTVLAFADAGHASLDPGEKVTGDAANITLKVEQDDDGTRSASNDTNPTETEDGQYVFDLTQAETNGDKLTFYPESSTAGVQVVALPSCVIYTRPPNFAALGIESDGDLTKVNTLDGHTAQTGDSFARLGAPAGASVSADIATVDGNVDTLIARVPQVLNVTALGNIGIDWANVENPSTAVDLAGTDIQLCDTVTTNSDMRGTNDALLASSAPTNFGDLSITVTTGRVDVATIEGSDATDQIRDAVVDDATRIDASALNTATTAIGSDGSGLTEAGGTGDQLTAVPWNSSWDAEVESECNDALVALKLDHLVAVAESDDPVDNSIVAKLAASDGDWSGYDNSSDSLEAIRDRGDIDWSSGAAANPNMILEAEVAVVNSQTEFTLATGADFDDAYNDQTIVLYDDSNNDYPSVRVISDYAGSTKTVTIDSAPDFTLGTDDSVKVFATAPGTSAPTAGQVADAVWDEARAGHTTSGTFGKAIDDGVTAWVTATGFSTHTAANVRSEIDSNSTQLAAIVADTNELQTDWANGGRLDLILDELTTQGDTNETKLDSLLARITSTLFSGITSLAEWIGLLAGKQTGDATARTELRATGVGSGTYDETTDSGEAIRDRGDASWITATSVTVSDKAGFSLAADGMDTVTLPADIITAASIATDAIAADGLAADAVSDIQSGLSTLTASQVNAQVVDVVNVDTLIAGQTIAEALRRIGTITSGEVSGAGTGTETFTPWDEGAETIVITVDSSGNRTAIAYN